jgi:hypothetical protein
MRESGTIRRGFTFFLCDCVQPRPPRTDTAEQQTDVFSDVDTRSHGQAFGQPSIADIVCRASSWLCVRRLGFFAKRFLVAAGILRSFKTWTKISFFSSVNRSRYDPCGNGSTRARQGACRTYGTVVQPAAPPFPTAPSPPAGRCLLRSLIDLRPT